MPVMNTLGALSYPKNTLVTLPSGLGWISCSQDYDDVNFIGLANTKSLNIDSSNNIYVAYRNTAGAGAGDHSIGLYVKLDSNGILQLTNGYQDSRTISGSYLPVVYLSAISDSSDNIYAVGTSTRISGSNGFPTIFITKFDSVGNTVWSNQYYLTTNDTAVDIKLDSSGNLYVTSFVSNAGSSIIIKINPSGVFQWYNLINTAKITGTTMSASNILYFTYYNSSTGVSGVASTDASGSVSLGFGATINSNVRNIALLSSGNVVVSTTTGLIILDSSGLIVAQKDFSLTFVDSRVCVDNLDNIYVMGSITGTNQLLLAQTDSSLTLNWANNITINPTFTSQTPLVSGISYSNNRIVVSFDQYDGFPVVDPIRSVFVMSLPTSGRVPMSGSYKIADNKIYYQTYGTSLTTSSYTRSGSASAGVHYTTGVTTTSFTPGTTALGTWTNQLI